MGTTFRVTCGNKNDNDSSADVQAPLQAYYVNVLKSS